VKNRATVSGAIEIGRLPGFVQVNLLAPRERLERLGILSLVEAQYARAA
jgi:formamidase